MEHVDDELRILDEVGEEVEDTEEVEEIAYSYMKEQINEMNK